MSRRVKTVLALGVVGTIVVLVLVFPVVSLGARSPHIRASAQRTREPSVAVPVEAAAGGLVVGVVLTCGLLVGERRATRPRNPRRDRS